MYHAFLHNRINFYLYKIKVVGLLCFLSVDPYYYTAHSFLNTKLETKQFVVAPIHIRLYIPRTKKGFGVLKCID